MTPSGAESGSPGRLRIAIVGAAHCHENMGQKAYEVGREVAERNAFLLCGGRSGVMQYAAEGAQSAGGMTVGILPGQSATDSPPNAHIDLPIFTGMGQARNLVLVLSAHAVIAIGGGWGTLSEIALAMKHGRPVVLLDSWQLESEAARLGLSEPVAATADEAVRLAFDAAAAKGLHPTG